MLLNLDLSKAFNKLSWQYIRKVLRAFGFREPWIRWIMSLISSTFFSILVNGYPSKNFMPTKGIRQGDILSPFLFVIMAQGLGHYLKAVAHPTSLKGISLHNEEPHTHKKFVDDNMLMGYPSIQEARSFNSIMDTFSLASCTTINIGKSHFFFFNTTALTQRKIACILGFFIASLPSKYLGARLTDSSIEHSSRK